MPRGKAKSATKPKEKAADKITPQEERAYIRSRINQAREEALARPGQDEDTQPGDPHGVSWVGHRSLDAVSEKEVEVDEDKAAEKVESAAEEAAEEAVEK